MTTKAMNALQPPPPKDDDEFLALLAEMRHAQRDYFRTRSINALNVAKSLEKRVDAELERRTRKQRELF